MTLKLTLVNPESASLYNEFKGGDKNQVVLQIPSSENDCQIPSLLVCPENDDFDTSQAKLYVTDLDSIFEQVKSIYADDPAALKRFSYYLVLKAKEMSK